MRIQFRLLSTLLEHVLEDDRINSTATCHLARLGISTTGLAAFPFLQIAVLAFSRLVGLTKLGKSMKW